MKKKKIWWLVLAVLIAVGAGIWWQVSTYTPYGRLKVRTALLIQIGNLVSGSEAPRAEDISDNMRKDVDEATLLLAADRPPFSDIQNKTLDGPAGPIPVRIYQPEGKGPFPIVVFFHGGGWVTGTIDHTENMCRGIAKVSPAVVISVAYRLAPENPYPASLDDAWAVLQQVPGLASHWNGDPQRIFVVGESAGANLAAALTLCARETGEPALSGQVLVYPFVNLASLDLPSFARFGHDYGLTNDLLTLTSKAYAPDSLLRTNPEVSPLLAPSHRSLPPALVMNAQFDPLQSQGEAYADSLEADGVPVIYELFTGVNHGFLTNDRFFGPEAAQAVEEIGKFIRERGQPLTETKRF